MLRKDSRGRTLKANESQRPDGRYQYKYSDNGKFKYLYSWTLTKMMFRLKANGKMCV